MSHEMTMRLIVLGFVATLFLVSFAMRVDSGGGRPAPATPAVAGALSGSQTPAIADAGCDVTAGAVVPNGLALGT